MANDAERVLDALGDPTRRAIISRLAAGPLPVAEISRGLNVGRPAVSMQLRVLKAAGLVTDRPAGNRRLYRLNPDGLAQLRDYLDWYWTQALGAYQEAAAQAAEGGGMNGEEPREVSVLKTVTVALPVARAFQIFIDQGAWWPVETHHLAEPAGDTVVLEPFAGGRWYERSADGTETDWGTVLAWEPPRRLLLSWQITPGWVYEPDPGRASEIEVRFIGEGESRTRVEFEHRRLERYAEEAQRMRSILDGPNGASGVLAAYAGEVRRSGRGRRSESIGASDR